MLNNELYFRNKSDCFEIDAGRGLRISELLGKQNGNSDLLSIAIEEFAPEGSSSAHYHVEAEEYQAILEGSGKLVVGNQTKIVTKGDFVKIPKGMRHQTFNDDRDQTLKLCCFLTPSWAAEDTTFMDDIPSTLEEKCDLYLRTKESIVGINPGKGEYIYEFLGKENGSSDKMSIALVEIHEGCSSEAHLHPDAEEFYIGIEGKGRLVVDGQTRIVSRDVLAKIPKGKVHQIFNDNKETLKFLCVCAPAWTPECYVKV